ncbi:YjfI family protein [Pseudomonadota bacterium]
MTNINTLAARLDALGKEQERGMPFEVNPIPGDIEVLQVLVEDREELPVYVSVSEEQILCIVYLFKDEEVKTDMVADLNSSMLTASISMPLSSFAKIEDRYVVFGALSVNSSDADIVHEIEVLSSNSIEAIDVMSDYLV